MRGSSAEYAVLACKRPPTDGAGVVRVIITCWQESTSPRPPLESKTMSPSSLNLTDIPGELLEQILLHLPGQDIVKMEAVRGVAADLGRIFVDFALAI